MNDEKKSWLDRAGAVHLWKTIEAILGTKVDKIEGFGLSSNDYTTEEKKKLASLSDPDVATTENNGLMSSADKAKLDGIEAGANNYTHPEYEAKQAGLYRISVDNTGHVVTADKMTSEELAAEGVSPADHTHDLGELVDTLETSADVVEDADTVMVGAIVTSDDGSATTKYTRRPLAALWNWIKSRTDTLYAAVGHTHNYAGSPEPGGDAIRALAVKDYAGSQTIEIGYASAGLTTSNLTHIAGYTDNGTKIKDVSKDVLKSWIGLGGYLPLSGGTMSGALNFANNTWNPVGDDVQIGDRNTSGSFYIQGLNGPTNIKLKKNSDTSAGSGDSATITYDGGNLIIDKTIQANLQGTADYANNLIFQKDQVIDTTSLNVNTQYPVIYHLPWTTLCHIECWTGLGTSGKPSWATHGSGFYADLDMLATASGWGCTNAHTVKILDTCSWCDTSAGKPIGYSQVITDSLAVFWVRGGGYYHFRSSTAENQTLITGSYSTNTGTLKPTTSYPGINYAPSCLDPASVISNMYPVGSIYMSTSSTSPASIFGGSWQSIASERVLMGVSGSHGAGSTVDAGLPNISSGSDAALDIQGSWGAPNCRAPFAQTWQGNSELSSSTWSSTPKVISARFDASLCNSIYGRSSTVQPAAYYVYMWRRTG